MKTFELIAPCHFGLEAVLKREIYDLGYEIIQVEDGRVTFEGDEETVCRANIFLRTAERVLLKAGQFHAETFEELFQGIKNIPWEDYIPKDGRFWVAKASSIKSRLFSPSDIQSIVKKAPDFEAISTFGEISLKDYQGKWLVLFSHPGDFTPVCTTEMIAFTRANPYFKELNTELLGLSVDSNSSHLA